MSFWPIPAEQGCHNDQDDCAGIRAQGLSSRFSMMANRTISILMPVRTGSLTVLRKGHLDALSGLFGSCADALEAYFRIL